MTILQGRNQLDVLEGSNDVWRRSGLELMEHIFYMQCHERSMKTLHYVGRAKSVSDGLGEP